MASLQARDLRLEMLPGQSPPRAPRRTPDVQELIYGQSPYGQSPAPALGPARVQELIHQAKERGQKLLALEANAKAEALFLLHEMTERAGEEARLATEVGCLQSMVEGQQEFDREAWLLEELELQEAHDDVVRLQEEQEAP